jgi:uncharacterized pyridoxal phosphate-dependent enzyme
VTNPVASYAALGVRPLINCIGTITRYSGSLMLPEVREAMDRAAQQYVVIEELQQAVGTRLGELMGAEFGLVTNGCGAALVLTTAACVAGDDQKKMAQLPDTTGLKNEIIIGKSHRVGYDRLLRAVGTTFVEVETADDLEAAFTDRTAMIFCFGDATGVSAPGRGDISFEQFVAAGKKHGVPVFVDAAAERPNAPNVYLQAGADAVAYSGGKCMRGPQSSGMLLGRKDLLWAAYMNGAPNANLGRSMKVGKEEIMGLLTAVENWVVRDHDAEWKEWERRLGVITDALSGVESLETAINTPGPSNIAPHLTLRWDADKAGISVAEARTKLNDGEPRIIFGGGAEALSINPYMLEEGDAERVAAALKGVLAG